MGLNWQEMSRQAEESLTAPPEGKTLLECTSAEWQTSSTGKQMIKAVYRIADGPGRGQHVTSYHVVSPDSQTAMRIFVRAIQAHGVDTASVSKDAEVTAALVGSTVVGTIAHEEWNGETRAQVRGFARAAPAGDAAGPSQAAAGPAKMFQ